MYNISMKHSTYVFRKNTFPPVNAKNADVYLINLNNYIIAHTAFFVNEKSTKYVQKGSEKMNFKIRLLQLGKTQGAVVDELHKRGYREVSASRFSSIIHNREVGKKADEIKMVADKIVSEWESEV